MNTTEKIALTMVCLMPTITILLVSNIVASVLEHRGTFHTIVFSGLLIVGGFNLGLFFAAWNLGKD